MTLVDELSRSLRRRGSAQARVPDDTEAAAWRSAARRAGRELGRPVRTYRFDSLVVAELTDWPSTELEQQLSDAVQRRIVEAAGIVFDSK